MINQVFHGDCLHILKESIEDESIDLIYLDPPYNTNRDWGEFDDTWNIDDVIDEFEDWMIQEYPGITYIFNSSVIIEGYRTNAYLVMMFVRLIELRRVLKDSGSIYLHCDYNASHYLKLVMDCVFGHEQFQNEIIWAYRTGGVSKKRFARKHDVILFYSKTNEYTFNEIKEKSYMGKSKPGFPGVNFFEDEKGIYRNVTMRDVWNIDAIGTLTHERLGYPTQKPIELLKRIVAASSNEGDLVLDPFCGSGTTMAAAQACNRNWIGIDKNETAIKIVNHRLLQGTMI